MRKNQNYTPAKLNTCGGDLKKQWFVSYFFRNPKTGKKERFRESEGINKFHSAGEREKAGEELVKKINQRLEDGYNPFQAACIVESNVLTSKQDNKKFLEVFDYVVVIKKQTTKKSSSRYYDTLRRHLVIFLKQFYFIDIQLNQVDKAFFVNFKNYLLTCKSLNPKKEKLSAKYINNLLVCVHAIFSELVQQGQIDNNPAIVKKLKAVSRSGIPFSKEHANILLNYCKTNDYSLFVFINFIYYTLGRPDALRLLKVGDIDLGKKTIRFLSENSKNGKTGYVAIAKPFMSLIEELELHKYPDYFFVFGREGCPSEHKVRKDWFWQKHYDALNLLNLKKYGYTLYCWKHTGAVNLYQAIKDVKRVSEQCLHSNILVTMNYLKNLGVVFGNDELVNNYPAIGT